MKGMWAIVVCCVLLAGCESLSEAGSAVRDRVKARDEGRTQNLTAPQREVYEAARQAAVDMGYRILRGGAAQGELDAVSALGSGDRNRSSRQLSMKVRLEGSEMAGGTEVNVLITEIIEPDSANRAGLAMETPLRDTPQYAVFFRSIQQALDASRGSGQREPQPGGAAPAQVPGRTR